MSATCEVVTEWGPGNTIARQCERPVVYRYAAMGGGYMHLCEQCGKRHHNYSERLVDGVWTETPELKAFNAAPLCRRGSPDREYGESLCAWMYNKGYTVAAFAEITGYAVSTVGQWRMGRALSRRARAALREAGFSFAAGR